MGKSTKTQHLREKMRKVAKQTKQTTLDSLSLLPKKKLDEKTVARQTKQIEITDVTTTSREDELVLIVSFKLIPSRTFFSRITADISFDQQQIESLRLRILQGPLATNEAEFSSVLDMTGIHAGRHLLSVIMHEFWTLEENPIKACKEISIEYIPTKREDRLIKVPIIKCVAGTDLSIVSESEKNIYREIEEEMKRQTTSRRDNW